MTDAPTNLYRCTPRRAKQLCIEVIQAGRVPFLQSSPGMGKSSIFRQIALEWMLRMIDHRIATSAPEDFTGLPEFIEINGIRRARFAPFADLFPLDSDEVPAGMQGWLLFLDEFNQGNKDVQAAAYKLVLDRMTGQHKLHPNLAIAMAGNLSTDRAITNDLSTAMQSRVIHIEMEINHPEWEADIALPQKYDPRIIAYLNWKSGSLMDFKPDHQEKTFACPRTWEFMNDHLRVKPDVTVEDTTKFAGTITSGVAADFVSFCQIYKGLITIKEILADPQNAHVPRLAEERWGVISHLIEKTTEKNFTDVTAYIGRFDLSFRILYFRGLVVQQPKIRSHPSFAKAMGDVSAKLNLATPA